MLKKIKILAKKLNLQGNSTYFVYVITLWMKFGANQNCNYFSTHIHGKEPYLIMKKLAILKIILFISIIGLIIFSLLFVLYIYDITQKNKTSENLASSFSVSYLYSESPSYTAALQNSNNISEEKKNFVIGTEKLFPKQN